MAEAPVPVIFKKERGGIFAAFPTLPGSLDPLTMCSYAHIGQHSSAHESYIAEAKPAHPEEYADLKRELEQIGYRLKIRRRMSQADRAKRIAALPRR